MAAFWQASVAQFLLTAPETIVAELALAQQRHYRSGEASQVRAWQETIELLRSALATAGGWHLLLEYPLLRLGRRADAIILTDRAVLVIEVKAGLSAGFSRDGREQVEDYALDLQDFHAGSRGLPIVPILVALDATLPASMRPLPLAGVLPVQQATRADLGRLLAELTASFPPLAAPLDAARWIAAPYRPVPTLIEAARMVYSRHGVAEIAAARADADSLGRTSTAIAAVIGRARAERAPHIAFVTGIPGAGKTLCGLNAAFGEAATFLTGNPSLVHVLREALARDVIDQGSSGRNARHRMQGVIQALPLFRDNYLATGHVPAEHVVVIDEAQRSWNAEHAIRKSRDRTVRLTDSEPGHLLDILARHQGVPEGWCAVICLVGGGQEIHDGEGGLAAWGAALQRRPEWRVHAAPDLANEPDPRRRLGALERLELDPALHLTTPIRAIRNGAVPSWVDAVLEGEAGRAGAIAAAAGSVPFVVSRELGQTRALLRGLTRGTRRCGLLASSGARRLRAEGLGAELPHMDPAAVARWFLDRFPPDVRASDALELVATEFSCQGLELDVAGLCWDGDLIRLPGVAGWQARRFVGTQWQVMRGQEAMANQRNTYRVLMTRARYETVLFVPRGDAGDRTRDPAVLDAVASFLLRCGAQAA